MAGPLDGGRPNPLWSRSQGGEPSLRGTVIIGGLVAVVLIVLVVWTWVT